MKGGVWEIGLYEGWCMEDRDIMKGGVWEIGMYMYEGWCMGDRRVQGCCMGDWDVSRIAMMFGVALFHHIFKIHLGSFTSLGCLWLVC